MLVFELRSEGELLAGLSVLPNRAMLTLAKRAEGGDWQLGD